MSVSSDRWSCPHCLPPAGTLVVIGDQADTAWAIKAVQERHRDAHRKAATIVGRLGLPESHPKETRRKAS